MDYKYFSQAPDGGAFAPSGITDKDLERADNLLREYINGKSALNHRLKDEEQWYQVHQDYARQLDMLNREAAAKNKHPDNLGFRRIIRSRSSLLFQAMWSHHNDDMDNVPQVSCLPRELSDEQSAELLSKIIPVVMQRARFVDTYSQCAWDKIKHGLCGYGVFWDGDEADGLGDVAIKRVDLLNLYWQPGVRELEESPNLFILSDERREDLIDEWPQLASELSRGGSERYVDNVWPHEDNEDRSKLVRVTDWYYRKRNSAGRKVTHLVKYAMGKVLYASENDPAYEDAGYYAHGRYPVVIDTLYPYTDTVGGFGLIAVGRSVVEYIETLDERIAEYIDWASRTRYWAKHSMGINADDFCNVDKRIVEVEGDIDEEKLRQITISGLDPLIPTIRESKANELKEISAARDVSQGGSGGGVTAASAIAALQEAGNKASRDEIGSSYRTLEQVAQLVIELIRQFYTEARVFRIVAPDGGVTYQSFDNSAMQAVPVGVGADGTEMLRKPVYDVDIRAAKMSPYSQVSQNSTMMEMFSAGVFSPQMADQSLIMLDGMDFPGIDELREKIRQGQSTYNLLMAAVQYIASTTGMEPEQVLASLTGGTVPAQSAVNSGASTEHAGSETPADGVERARTPMQERYAASARADADKHGEGASQR